MQLRGQMLTLLLWTCTASRSGVASDVAELMHLRSSSSHLDFKHQHELTRVMNLIKDHKRARSLLRVSKASPTTTTTTTPAPVTSDLGASDTGKNTCSQYSIPANCKNVDEPGCHWIPYQCPVGWILGGDDVQGNVVSEYTDCCVRGTCQEYGTEFHPCSHNADHMCMTHKSFNCTEHTDSQTGEPLTENHEWDYDLQVGNFQKQPNDANPEQTCCKRPTCGEFRKDPQGFMHAFNCSAYGREENHHGFPGWWQASPKMEFLPGEADSYLDVCCSPLRTEPETNALSSINSVTDAGSSQNSGTDAGSSKNSGTDDESSEGAGADASKKKPGHK